MIRHLRHRQIDKSLWDRCITQSGIGLAYPLSWYLDAVSPQWEALVWGNYDAVMPLPVIKRYGIKWSYQPWFCQQLGIIAKTENAPAIVTFLKTIPWYYINVRHSFNYTCNIANLLVAMRTNYILPLTSPYPALAAAYSVNTRRNIKKAGLYNLTVDEQVFPDEFIAFETQHQADLLKPKHRIILSQLITALLQHNAAQLVGLRNSSGTLICAVCLVKGEQRLTYLLAASSAEGKATHAMFLLVDTLIKQHAGTPKILDFEGSMIPGVARFYKSFGATDETYWHYCKRHWLKL